MSSAWCKREPGTRSGYVGSLGKSNGRARSEPWGRFVTGRLQTGPTALTLRARLTFPGFRHILTAFQAPFYTMQRTCIMEKRANAATFKGKPVTLVGPQLKPGDKAPDF